MRVRQVTVWAVPVLVVAVLAAVSAVWGVAVAATVLGGIVVLGVGWAVGAGMDPAKKAELSTSVVPKKDGSLLTGADLSGADLTGADLRGLDLRDVKLNHAILRNADLRGAKLSQEPEE